MASSEELSPTCQVLYDQLKCIFCENHVSAGKYRWYKCFKGKHQICQDCKETKSKASKCCGMPVSDYCEMTKELLKAKTMKFKCKNTSEGCQQIYGEEAMIAHEAECIYRYVTCPNFFSCEDDMLYHEFFEHIEKDDDIVKIEPSNLKVVKVKSDYFVKNLEYYDEANFYFTPYKFVFHDRVFLFNGVKYQEDDTFYFWVQMVGSKFEAKIYYYTLEFHGIDPNVKTLNFDQVLPLDETLDSIKEAKKYFGIDFEIFKTKFVDEDRYFEFSISIKNMKEEAKDDNEESGISDDE